MFKINIFRQTFGLETAGSTQRLENKQTNKNPGRVKEHKSVCRPHRVEHGITSKKTSTSF